MIDIVLARYIYSDKVISNNNVSSATITFLTDGEDGSSDRKELVPFFKEMLITRWKNNPITVHTIGFGASCDRNLLEGMRTAGNIEGMFRYAEPNDNDDTLCQKLTSIFEVSTKTSTVPITLNMDGKLQPIQFPIDSHKRGEYPCWIDEKVDEKAPHKFITISSLLDHDVKVPVTIENENDFVLKRWLNHNVDQMAEHILALNSNINFSQPIKELQCALLLTKIENILTVGLKIFDNLLSERLQYLKSQIEEIRIGKTVNISRLSDLRFSSHFEEKKRNAKEIMTIERIPPPPSDQKLIKVENEPHPKHYSRNSNGKGRNIIQEIICENKTDNLPLSIYNQLDKITIDDIIHKDNDGNNTIMLAAYCGCSKILSEILKRFPQVNLAETNNHNETATTLAIKKQGFHHALGYLLDAGATIPRPKKLERYAIENGYPITAQIISTCNETSVMVDSTMKNDYIEYLYQRTKNAKNEENFNKIKFLEVALEKNILPIVNEIISDYKILPTIDMLVKYCIPKKPDDPETDKYLHLAQILINVCPDLINQTTKPEEESALFTAARKGSLPHVKYFISKGAIIDQPNEKGNTPLWVACYQRYPCIVDELLNNGADINRENLKGNTPFYGLCERGGSKKIAEKLIARGSNIENINKNGDTLVLICSRNGQHEVLELLLQYVDDEFINRKAHIDGFNAIMASTEQNRPECIKVLHDFKVNLNQKTDPDNAILASATPLHIAAHYNRAEAMAMLLQLGADPNIPDKSGQTPLHLAVIQGNIKIIQLLRQFNANCNTQDNSFNTPIAYCRDRDEIRRALIDPLSDILFNLVRGIGFDEKEQQQACVELLNYKDALGNPLHVDIKDNNESTPLLYAVIYRNYDVIETLLQLNADPMKQNIFTMNAMLWSKWLRNIRIFKLLCEKCPPNINDIVENSIQLKRLQQCNNRILFLGRQPVNTTDNYDKNSQITLRMEGFINTPFYDDDDDDVNNNNKNTKNNLLQLENCSNSVVEINVENGGDYIKQHQNEITELIWNAKIFTIHKIAQGTNNLSASEIFALCGYSTSYLFYEIINTVIISNIKCSSDIKLYADILYTSLHHLPAYTGEAFLGSATANRKLFLKGQEFYFKHFVSSTTLWKVALENTPSFFNQNNRKGVIFIIKSKTGKCISLYSKFSHDSEVIFLPNTKFKVTNWYHADVIALGQENIREHSFGVKEIDSERMNMEQLIQSDKSIIIELTEM
jgi:ankyrin repeat protein